MMSFHLSNLSASLTPRAARLVPLHAAWRSHASQVPIGRWRRRRGRWPRAGAATPVEVALGAHARGRLSTGWRWRQGAPRRLVGHGVDHARWHGRRLGTQGLRRDVVAGDGRVVATDHATLLRVGAGWTQSHARIGARNLRAALLAWPHHGVDLLPLLRGEVPLAEPGAGRNTVPLRSGCLNARA